MKTEDDSRVEFFDKIACEWDSWHDIKNLTADFQDAFNRFGILPGETIVDLGCGTGNLTMALLSNIPESEKVIALDISPEMLKVAQDKCSNPRASWFLAAADHIPVEEKTCDRVICFSAWPHFENAQAVIREIKRILKPEGCCHILHFISRDTVNSIHREAHSSVKMDILRPAKEVAELFRKEGFIIEDSVDDEKRYLVTARNRKNFA